ncbi:hypothetical protein BA1DRAFT_04153 [Photorhabdus aegyptia]|uniref:Uncharacterized protein n=1 Tax=Photorhabdus aegyptia TaxID=2805098 RepID=A0A022PFX5_9GAMM|nr:hypothetical protein BA1DRAFT_04153 [Photorhabdus aegyptia]
MKDNVAKMKNVLKAKLFSQTSEDITNVNDASQRGRNV